MTVRVPRRTVTGICRVGGMLNRAVPTMVVIPDICSLWKQRETIAGRPPEDTSGGWLGTE